MHAPIHDRRLRNALLLSLAVVAGCGKIADPIAACTGDVAVQVTATVRPTISWSPACSATQVSITDPASSSSSAATIWALTATSELIRPPVTYGVVVAGASQPTSGGTIPDLVVGHAYVAHVFHAGTGGSDPTRNQVAFTVH